MNRLFGSSTGIAWKRLGCRQKMYAVGMITCHAMEVGLVTTPNIGEWLESMLHPPAPTKEFFTGQGQYNS
jgi:hypothetical protein